MTSQEIHKNWEYIKAFKEGKVIQYLRDGEWLDTFTPSFHTFITYRVKPIKTQRMPTYEEVFQWYKENKIFKNIKTNRFVRINSIHDANSVECISMDYWQIKISSLVENFTDEFGNSLKITVD